jgi:LmbE family N-acetylglucosaminyl deacetylase
MRRMEARLIYLSPHLDDAVLSCGGLIHQQVQGGAQPLVITCFAGVPDYHVLSPFAADQHRRWGQPADPVAQRRAEDAAALAHLGAACEHWDYLDCIYRRDPASGEFLYASEDALWGPVAGADGELIASLTARLSQALSPAQTQLYAPLAVGQHVDHQLVLRVALLLRRRGWSVQFYEDYPYAEDPQKLAGALDSWSRPPTATVVRLSEQDLGGKTAAIRCYASQLAVLFGTMLPGNRSIAPCGRPGPAPWLVQGEPQSPVPQEIVAGPGGLAAVAERVRAYALAVGGGDGYGERYWSSSNPASLAQSATRGTGDAGHSSGSKREA